MADKMALEAELESLRAYQEKLRASFDVRRRIYRLILILDSYVKTDEAPGFILDHLEQLIPLFNGTPEFFNNLLTDKRFRQVTLDKLKIYLIFFIEHELDEDGRKEISTWDATGEWMDTELYLQLIPPADPIVVERLKREPIEIVTLLAREIVKKPKYWSRDLTSADELIKILENPNKMAKVAARRGNFKLLTKALSLGANDYGKILVDTFKFPTNYPENSTEYTDYPGEYMVFVDTIDRQGQEKIRDEIIDMIRNDPTSPYIIESSHHQSGITFYTLKSKLDSLFVKNFQIHDT
jgi:hypothetical protein